MGGLKNKGTFLPKGENARESPIRGYSKARQRKEGDTNDGSSPTILHLLSRVIALESTPLRGK